MTPEDELKHIKYQIKLEEKRAQRAHVASLSMANQTTQKATLTLKSLGINGSGNDVFEVIQRPAIRHEALRLLLQSAPDLLEALERLTGLLRDSVNIYGNATAAWIMQQPSFSLAEAAISKAQGEL